MPRRQRRTRPPLEPLSPPQTPTTSTPLPAKFGMDRRTIHMSDYGHGLKNKIHQGDQVFPNMEEFLQKFVEHENKRRPIRKILIATNGIAAVKAINSIRKLLMQLFRDDRLIKFIAMTTEQEMNSNAEYIKMADKFVVSPGGDNRNNYANVDEIVQHAVEQNVDAVWAGWGHASENPALPSALKEKNIVFIGPPASAMFSLGDKIASTIIAQTLDIPTIEWSGSGLRLDLEDQKGEYLSVGQELFNKACVSDLYEGLRALDTHKIGYPMMIKASEGGGGKGIRKCKNEADFKENFVQVQTEVPGSPIFLMKCVENARHIEVQLIADRYDTVIPIFTRDCSIQRRCQKIIEEAPASIASPETLKNMQTDAVKIAKLVGYESAGTVEYMYLPSEDKYYFLELNPRLQVEHPCTEMLASINIPAIQLQIAMGLPLHRIVDIRLFYGLERYGTTSLPEEVVRSDPGYAVIAARITSEDPEDFFRPSTGAVEVLNFRSAQNVWGYFSVSSSGKVHEFADSQFGHLFAKGRTRHEAVSVLLCALQELELRATFKSQVMYLVDLLKEPDFTENKFNTQWLDNRIANQVLQKPPLPKHEMIAVSSAVIGHARVTSSFTNFRTAVENGQILPTNDLNETFVFDLVKDMQIFKLTVTRSGPINYNITLNNSKTSVEIRLLGDGSLLVTHKEKSYTCHLEETSDKFKVMIGRSLVVFEKDNDPTILKSPYTGKLLSYKKKDKEWVGVGAIYAAVESMKLVFNVEVKKAPGRLEYVAKEGDLLYPGSVIARLVDQKDSEKYKPKPFTEEFAEWAVRPDSEKNVSEVKQYGLTYDKCVNVLNGSIPAETDMAGLVEELFSALQSTTLPYALLKTAMTPMLARLPDSFSRRIRAAVEAENINMGVFQQVRSIIDEYFGTIEHSAFETAKAVCNTLYTTCEKFEHGILSNTCSVLNQLLDEYKQCEEFFEGRQYDDAVAMLNEKFPSDKERVVKVIYSHAQLKNKNKFLIALLKGVEKRGMHLVAPLADNLRDIGNMFHTDDVSLECRLLQSKNTRIKYRKFLNKSVMDLQEVPLAARDAKSVLSVDEAVKELKELLQKHKDAAAGAPKNIPWLHKVIHEFFFDDVLADYAVRTYIGLHFATTEIQQSELALGNGVKATVYDFAVDATDPVHHMMCKGDNSQYVSIVKFSVPAEQFTTCVDAAALGKGLVDKYTTLGVKANGRKASLKLTLLVNVEQPTAGTAVDRLAATREEMLEEVPRHDQQDEAHVAIAETAASALQSAMNAAIPAVRTCARVLVCNQNKPMMQVDLLGSKKLELWRLPQDVQLVSNRLSNLHIYRHDDPDKKFAKLFVREIVEVPIRKDENEEVDFEEIESIVVAQLDAACGEINVAMRKGRKAIYVGNHVLLHVTFPKLPATFTGEFEDALDDVFETAVKQQREILFKHHVTEVEVVYAKTDASRLVKRRVKFLDETGVTPEFGVYDEYKGGVVAKKLSHQLYANELQPHPLIKKIEKKRASTRMNGTTYVYDFPTLFGRACLEEWRKLADSEPLFAAQFAKLTAKQQEAFDNSDYRQFFDEEELVVKDGELVKVTNAEELKHRADNCNNEAGVVAWQLKLYTPEKPLGYPVVVISNDITFQSGSFATPEDEVYSLASEYSRKHKIPRVNVSSNSGARIGLAEEVSKVFRAKFKDSERPEEGFEYLYVDGSEEERLKEQIVYDKLPNGTLRLRAVVGKKEENIGVENLQGSGLIAGETSAAYDEVPTYCFVTGRTVGIGAYTARLAHRIVQAKSSHIILTGAPALNTLLGKEVYTSNNQLGGIQIMFKNGVTHAVVNDDFDGICKIVQWMGYLPTQTVDFPYQQPFGRDSERRPVEFEVEPNKAYDVRQLIDSRDSTSTSGICDSNSFDEIMNDWAKTIIAGRARLCGMPIGVVSSELRNVSTVNPADPAAPNSQSVEVHQAGQVWYPDSAFKTAECINDFNREKLPLLFIASLRGFSGGQKDMYEMVLKFGAQIVDALRQYKQPVVIYIPTHGELRGGAWAVLDSKINPGFITMVADQEARGGILEPSAIVGIKFRGDKLLALQKRNDEIMQGLDQQLAEEVKSNGSDSDQAAHLRRLLAKRSEDLKKAYRGVTVELADLHDRPERMERKGAVQYVTKLEESRNLFNDLFTVESAKCHLAERYLSSVAERGSNPQEAYRWLSQQLELFEPGTSALSPADQLPVVRRYAREQFDRTLHTCKAESVERELMSMSEAELAQMKRILEACASRRKFSL